jgi:hypothetical protein
LDLENYEIYFCYRNEKLRIGDPLEHSVENFVKAIEKNTEPLIGAPHILHNMTLLKEIDHGLGEFEKRASWKN